MPYTLPPKFIAGSVALVAGAANVTVQAAPGVGFRHRLVGGVFSLNRLATGIVDLSISSGGVLIAVARGLSVAGTPVHPIIVPEPGLQFADNEAIVLSTTSTVATGTGLVLVYFFTDTST